jgi:NADPH-dependent 2,4-dienoyl-CoA reductase/sulfur reductase-like enzyme
VRRECQTDILIVGGGLGGIAGALAALRLGKKIVLTEETDWIGGADRAGGSPGTSTSGLRVQAAPKRTNGYAVASETTIAAAIPCFPRHGSTRI